ncbi:MAG: glycoside hydrolase family 38 C-terminal domain-containing protein [Planctomycetota bacterium]
MLPRTPFLQLVAPRFPLALKRLREATWRIDPAPLPVAATEPTRAHRSIRAAAKLKYRAIKKTPYHWGELFDQCFFRIDLRGRPTAGKYLLWRDRGEATVYRDQTPLFGVDPGHIFQPLPDRATTLTVESICCRSGIWVLGETQGIAPEGSRFDGAYLAERSDDAYHLSLDLEVLLDHAFALIRRDTHASSPEHPGGYRAGFDTAHPQAKRILAGLDPVADRLDAGDLTGARRLCGKLMKSLAGQGDPTVTNVMTGHAHLDLVWLWPENCGEFKATHSFANALSLMDRYPEFVFGYSQPISYEALDRRTPKIMPAIQARVKEGRWEHAGATYVESDTQLPCGENLLRAFELGQADLTHRFGKPSNVLWIPDVFGYSACVPQLMAGFGVDYFYTTKQHWSRSTPFPYSSFRWRGRDGTEVLSHVSFYYYNQEGTPTDHRRAADFHRQAGVHDEALVPIGYGDGGGGPNAEMIERARRTADLAGLPRSRWGRIDEFFDRMADRRDDLPVHTGEIYMEGHRGVQTTHGNLKAAFRAAERGLQTHEAAHALRGRGPIDQGPWKRLVYAQFHDHIPGSSIQRVYDEGVPELESIASDATAAAASALSRKNAAASWFNPLPLPVRVTTKRGVVELPPLSVTPRDTKPTPAAVAADEKSIKGPRLQARFNRFGEVTRLVVDGHAVALREPIAQLWTYHDVPMLHEAWDLDRHVLSNGRRVGAPADAQAFGDNTPIAGVAFRRSLGDAGDVTIRYTLEADASVLRIDLELDWQAGGRLLKLVCPTDYRGAHARYGAPFGSAPRPQLPGGLAADAAFEVPGSRWAAVADDTEADGLMLVTRDKYGFGSHDGTLHLSVVRSAKVTPANRGATVDTLEAAPDADFSDLGRHRVRLALGRYTADAPRSEQPAVLADTLFTEPIEVEAKPTDALLPTMSDTPASLVPAWVKPTGDGCLLRLHETLGRRGRLRLDAAPGTTLAPATLPGEPTGDAKPRLTLDVTPYQLSTVRVYAKK